MLRRLVDDVYRKSFPSEDWRKNGLVFCVRPLDRCYCLCSAQGVKKGLTVDLCLLGLCTKDQADEGRRRRLSVRPLDQEPWRDWGRLELRPCPSDRLDLKKCLFDDDEEEEEEEKLEEALPEYLCWSTGPESR